MGLNAAALAAIRSKLASPGDDPDQALLESVLRIAGIWRSRLLANSLIALYGPRVLHGPFEGMRYIAHAAEGALLPRLVGSYESELHPHIAALIEEGLDVIVDVGCAEEYYAVGLARLAPDVQVHAFDIDEGARRDCAAMAELNGVQDRVTVGAAFAPEAFADYAGRRTLIFMDVEGAENALLRPDRYPALKDLKILVETHPGPGSLCDDLMRRFEATHEVIRIDQGPKTTPLPPWMRTLGHLDQLIAVWEWRRWPTPWLVMRPKAAAAWGRP